MSAATNDRGITCEEFVEQVTDYLEGAMDADTSRRFDAHAALCPGCDTYLDQIRATIDEFGRLTPDNLDPEVRDRMLEAFRDWSREPPAV